MNIGPRLWSPWQACGPYKDSGDNQQEDSATCVPPVPLPPHHRTGPGRPHIPRSLVTSSLWGQVPRKQPPRDEPDRATSSNQTSRFELWWGR